MLSASAAGGVFNMTGIGKFCLLMNMERAICECVCFFSR